VGAWVEWLAVAAAGYMGQFGEAVGLSHPAALRVGQGLAAVGRCGRLVMAAPALVGQVRRPPARSGASAAVRPS
jgi:hypothetical protein